MKRFLALILCIMMMLSVSVFAAAEAPAETPVKTFEELVAEAEAEITVLGEGEVMMQLIVTDGEGNTQFFEINTDEETVGAALVAAELVEGEEGPYGLYVKTVCGITADYDKDGTYWAFYINDEYAMTGVDATPIEDAVYTLKVEG